MQTNISRWSKSAVDYFGLPGEYMEKADEIWESYIHPDDREVYRRDIEAVFSGKKKYHELEYRVRNREGNYVICTCKGVILYGENGEPDLFAGTLSNHGIISNIDATTNLYNIYEFLNAVRQIGKTGEPTTLLMIGINQFRAVNDIYDYAFGNEVLREFASRGVILR
jgi:PAS domain S-box-containing protein